MIIRSQDKKSIINLANIHTISCHTNIKRGEIKENYEMDIRYYSGTKETMGLLATYSTEEKAIKVLDMIQNKYVEYAKVASAFGEDIRGLYVLPRVFQMPQDSEV